MKQTPTIRVGAVAAGAVLALALAACSSASEDGPSGGGTAAAGGSALKDVQVMMYPSQSYRLPVVIADQQGFFKKHGIKISVVAQPNNLQGTQAILATKSQVGQMSTPTITQGVEAGTPVRFFCGGINVLQTTLFAKNGSTLPATDSGASWQQVLKSLDGKKVGIQTPIGSGLQLLFAEALKEAGVTNVTYVNVGGGNNLTLAALNNGTVDVAQVNPTGTQYMTINKAAKPLIYMSQGPEAYKLYGSGWTAPTQWLKDDPATAAGFCDAVKEGLAFIKDPANADAAAQALAKDAGVAPNIAALTVKQAYSDYSTDLDQATLQKTFDTYARIGITKTKLDYSQIVQVPKP